MPRASTYHMSTGSLTHEGEFSACLECNHISFWYALRTVTGRLLADGPDEGQMLALLDKDPGYRLHREVWQQQDGQPVLIKVERIGFVGRFDVDLGRVVSRVEVIED